MRNVTLVAGEGLKKGIRHGEEGVLGSQAQT